MNKIKLFHLNKRGFIQGSIYMIMYIDIDELGRLIAHHFNKRNYRVIIPLTTIMRDNTGHGLLLIHRGEIVNTNYINKRRKFRVEFIILENGTIHKVGRALIRIMEKSGKQSYTENKIKKVSKTRRK